MNIKYYSTPEEIRTASRIALERRLYVKLDADEWGMENLYLRSTSSSMALAFINGTCIGACTVEGDERLSNHFRKWVPRRIQCFVDGPFRRKGVGSALVQEMKARRKDAEALRWYEGISGSKDFWKSNWRDQ